MDNWLTVRMVSEALKITEGTCRVWIESGKLPASKICKGWRISERDLKKLLKQKQWQPLNQA
jgi:excisionase family DNA binding protein